MSTVAASRSCRLPEQRPAQREWAAFDIRSRLRVLRRFRQLTARRARVFAEAVGREDMASTLTAEVLPLLEACRFLERRAKDLLAPRTITRADRPVWLRGVQLE